MTVAELSAADMEVMVGAPGTVNGVPLTDADSPVPAALVAVTEQL